MKLDQFAINGLFLAQQMTGVHRYARELVCQLDKIVPKDTLQIVVPKNQNIEPDYSNIKLVEYGNLRGIPWEQISFLSYVRKNKLTSINLCNEQPLFAPGIICIHDVMYKTHPQFFTTLHGRLSSLWHRLVFMGAAKSRYPLITVSNYSKQAIVETYGISPCRVHVIANAWQHIERCGADNGVLDNNNLEPGQFYFTLGNVNINKNTKWVIDYARNHPDDLFVLSGPKAKVSNIDIEADNVIYLGYLTDPEIKALFKACKAFIFPSIHEGFGIPPLEALSQGASIFVSNTTSLPEIFENSAHYINPFDTNVNLDDILKTEIEPAELVLEKYSWEKSARELLNILQAF